MGNAILDVVLGLVLIYVVLALLAMKLQELTDGSVLRGRVSILHELLLEACGQSPDLKAQVMGNPLIYALYRGDAAKKNTLTPSSGPTSIPPDLFARALLMALNDGGKTHPSKAFSTPARFVESRADKKADQPFARTWQSISGLLVGQETSWAGFEAAIAKWFSDIGDRADGWFKRRSQGWSLGMALLLAAGLNADSLHIASTLASDSEQRAALADIALRVDAQRQAGAGNAASPAAAAIDRPDVQVAARLSDAIARLSDAAQRDKGFASFTAADLPNQLTLKISKSCPSEPATKGKPPTLAAVNTVAWLYILPVVRTNIELARTQDEAKNAREIYDEAFNCLAHLSSWLTIASSFSTDASARGLALDANAAIESAKSALIVLREQKAAPFLIKRAFLDDPETFQGCAEAAGSRSEFEACLQRARSANIRLPLLFIGSTVRPQFCKLALPSAEPPKSGWCTASFEKDDKLGLPAMSLVAKEGAFWPWLGGVLFTALFVALGAPFWFDLLGKVASLRSAGSVRDAADDAKRGRGTLPPPPAPAPGPDGRTKAAGTPFSDARNDFELSLTVALIIGLQQVLRTKETGRLDDDTRTAIEAWCSAKQHTPTKELDRELYYAITGRDIVKSPAIPATLQLGRSNSWVQPVVSKLTSIMKIAYRVTPATTSFDAEVRALTVLYRYKKETGPVGQRQVVKLAEADPAALDTLDAATIAEIDQLDPLNADKKFDRSAAPWLDWALGELGQVEKDKPTRETSNRRICDYLDTVPGSGANGDKTPWCGAFAAWVITRHNQVCAAEGTAPLADPLPLGPLRAKNWEHWGSGSRNGKQTGALALQGAQPGDIVLFQPEGKDSSGHVAFFIEFTAGTLWVLGGNQSGGSRVSLIAYAAAKVVTVRKP